MEENKEADNGISDISTGIVKRYYHIPFAFKSGVIGCSITFGSLKVIVSGQLVNKNIVEAVVQMHPEAQMNSITVLGAIEFYSEEELNTFYGVKTFEETK